MNPRVKKIIDVKPFAVTVKWTNGETRIVDFNEFLSEEKGKKGSVFKKLFNPETFMKVRTDGRTLYWENLTEMLDENGRAIPAPIDFCPDVLFGISKEV
jgi:Protein of unknown function (DUF2442)